ncbi:transcription termination/antitermination protein NusG [Ensifer adhaerens]|uniref:Transcription termination/antitermination NusG family protein n=2 Tax=Ensifer adhaerens TaxID=106592 RepID=A0ABY8HCX9_ENSAD|nr:transcription termination/antitermination NusG family protein [Ensifer adhaerens]WFP89693.1 transcription termination/antitermination NusG family protein [Ensifer adhaerens]
MKGQPIATQAKDGFRDRMRRITQASLKAATMKVTEMHPDSARWYCLHVKKGREFDVENTLAAANVEAYMPREKDSYIRRGKKIDVVQPAVPGYLLVRLVPSPEAFLGLRHQNHVVDFVGGTGGYHVVKDVHVAVFKALFGDGNAPRVATDKTIGQGTEADIVFGPFTGFRCVVTAVKWCREARASVRIDVQGRSFDIERMPLAHLKKL